MSLSDNRVRVSSIVITGYAIDQLYRKSSMSSNIEKRKIKSKVKMYEVNLTLFMFLIVYVCRVIFLKVKVFFLSSDRGQAERKLTLTLLFK